MNLFNTLCRCNEFLVECFQLQISDLAAELAVRSIVLDIYDLEARIAATLLIDTFLYSIANAMVINVLEMLSVINTKNNYLRMQNIVYLVNKVHDL